MVFGRGFTFMLGSLFGAYVVQNYRIPRIDEWVHNGCARARELEKAHRRPENFSPYESRPAHDGWMRSRYHDRTYQRPEIFYSNEAHEGNRGRHMDLDGTYYRPEAFNSNEVHENENKNKVRPRDLNKPYNNNGTDNFNPNEAGQE